MDTTKSQPHNQPDYQRMQTFFIFALTGAFISCVAVGVLVSLAVASHLIAPLSVVAAICGATVVVSLHMYAEELPEWRYGRLASCLAGAGFIVIGSALWFYVPASRGLACFDAGVGLALCVFATGRTVSIELTPEKG